MYQARSEEEFKAMVISAAISEPVKDHHPVPNNETTKYVCNCKVSGRQTQIVHLQPHV